MRSIYPLRVIDEDFLIRSADDPWGGMTSKLDQDMVSAIRTGPIDGRADVEVAMGLAGFADDELTRYGTDGSQTLDDREIALVLTALAAACRRLGITFEVPFRNFTTFRTYWNRNDGHGSWQVRREMVTGFFEPLHLKLARLEEGMLEALSTPISPHAQVGWPLVDTEILELRRRFETATTPQDYRALGTNIVGVLEALSAIVYDPLKHLRAGEEVPPVDKTKNRIGRYVEDSLPGPHNVEVRGLATKAVELAHKVKHSATSTRRDAGIAADAVILLANILKRLEQTI